MRTPNPENPHEDPNAQYLLCTVNLIQTEGMLERGVCEVTIEEQVGRGMGWKKETFQAPTTHVLVSNRRPSTLVEGIIRVYADYAPNLTGETVSRMLPHGPGLLYHVVRACQIVNRNGEPLPVG